MSIPVIDIFAGPGGLGEGFSNVLDERDERVFEMKLSIEKDEQAHKTLQLRSFFRQFPVGVAPDLYYEYIKANNLRNQSQILEELKFGFSVQWRAAEGEAAKIQTFSDNYLCGDSTTHQYHQVGNAVQPSLAKQIAEIVLKMFKERKQSSLYG